jgi:DNA polymerase-3 subunit alpha
VRSDYSLGESSFQIGKIIDQAKAKGVTHVALVDYMSVSAFPTFSDKCAKAGITPIAGVTLNVVNDPTAKLKDRPNGAYRLKVYAKNEHGFKSIFAALTKSLSPEHFYYSPRLGLEDILALEDVVVTTGDINGLWGNPDALAICTKLQDKFGEDLYIELVAIKTPLFDRLNTIALHRANALNTIVTRPAFYATPEDANATDVLRAISTNTQVDSMFLPRPYMRDLCMLEPLRLAIEAKDAFHRCGTDIFPTAALRNIGALADKCQYKFVKLAPCMPKMAEDEFAALMAAVGVGWKKRFATKVWGHRPDPTNMDPYRERLKFELGVLKKMGFSGYFLLVQDIVNWAKDNGVLVGPGRGSVGGSLVAYLMGITDIDPIRFDLLFERFINPDRTDLPDADLDFMSGKRHMVVDYIINKYGRENVAGIVNFSTLGPASALRDTARLHGLDPWEYACSKQMEKDHGVSVSLTESAERVPDIEKFKNERPVLWDYALRLEGANRSLSQHAAGIVVAGEPVVNRSVVSTRGELPVIQWDKRQVENFGLIKIDVLGLNTLDLIDCALTYIWERHHKRVNTLDLPLDDVRVLNAFGKGDTVGVFQFTGAGMRKLLREMAEGGRLDFNDLCAATALFRPGPLDAGLCDRYVQVKQGVTKPYYEHPRLVPILEKTLGVMAYQEQTMKVAQVIAGFTPGEADLVRKAIGKKDAEKMAELGGQFVAGAVAGYAEVELEDGTKVEVHRLKKLRCADGKLRTIDEALAANADVLSFT